MFKVEDFKEYASWFEDPELNRELGPMDQEWLNHVLSEIPPRHYSVFDQGRLVAVVGTELPGKRSSTWVVTDIAVKPTLKRQGIARSALSYLIQIHQQRKDPPGSWVAWVNERNIAALEFFESLGWNRSDETDVEDMYQFTLEMIQ